MPGSIENEDVPMEDVHSDDEVEPTIGEDGNWVSWKDRIRVLTGATETAASFQFEGEDHTLGNALRYIIMKNPDVEFCGYSIPHPSESKMNLRIQTYDGVSVYSVLEKGLNDLIDLCDVVTEKFTAARDAYGKQ
ncbi:RBP11-like subunits of RNA polymerase [Delitschia confertaspora ATCC 74209]|uniref:DNA-directed RNA polymerases I and III subunit RPAC2 n=1 Tax=Delitschia confertaspora ATCC 74209 TaxID=1513339 RepID=A0A9P4JMD1_9PLEO|nr:RBP11-like subunits of RNA polymerase [Delitschia confertaspora ATCC 74209]